MLPRVARPSEDRRVEEQLNGFGVPVGSLDARLRVKSRRSNVSTSQSGSPVVSSAAQRSSIAAMRAACSAFSVAGSSGGLLGRATGQSLAAPETRFPPVAQRHVISCHLAFLSVGGRAAETRGFMLIARVRPQVGSG